MDLVVSVEVFDIVHHVAVTSCCSSYELLHLLIDMRLQSIGLKVMSFPFPDPSNDLVVFVGVLDIVHHVVVTSCCSSYELLRLLIGTRFQSIGLKVMSLLFPDPSNDLVVSVEVFDIVHHVAVTSCCSSYELLRLLIGTRFQSIGLKVMSFPFPDPSNDLVVFVGVLDIVHHVVVTSCCSSYELLHLLVDMRLQSIGLKVTSFPFPDPSNDLVVFVGVLDILHLLIDMRFQSIVLEIMSFLFPDPSNHFEIYQSNRLKMDMDILEVEDDMDFLGVEDYGASVSFGAIHSFCGRKYMTPSFNQQDLNSCMSCTLSASLGALYAIENAQCIAAPDFSKQEMVDCQPITYSGTRYPFGYGYVFGRGLHTEEEYPYVNEYNSSCRCLELRGRPKICFQHYQFFDDYLEALPFLYQQPLTAGLVLYRSFEQFRQPYKSVLELLDIYSPELGEEPLFWPDGSKKWHAILVIGLGIMDGEEYCIIKNWSGVHWGANGYARIKPKLLHYWGCSRNISIKQL